MLNHRLDLLNVKYQTPPMLRYQTAGHHHVIVIKAVLTRQKCEHVAQWLEQ